MVAADVPIDQAYLDAGRWEVEIAGKRYPAVASLRPMYDPEMKRVKV
jgi:4-methylaminobutanoate oxidase (formaldehyde-forming)